MFYRLAPMMGLVAGLGLAGSAIGPVRAQVNIDQGKSAAEIFAGDCATCHKSARGLADGRNSLTLTAFLREHYTSSGQQAAMLAAYVLGAGAGPAPAANLKQGGERNKNAVEEPKAGEPKTGEAKTGEARANEAKLGESKPGEPRSKTAARPTPGSDGTRIEAPGQSASSGRRPGRRETRPVTASRGARQEPETPAPAPHAAPLTPEPAPAASEPAPVTPVATAPANPEATNPPSTPVETPAMPATAAAPGAAASDVTPPAAPPASNPEASSAANAAAPAESAPSEGAPVPRDNIPD